MTNPNLAPFAKQNVGRIWPALVKFRRQYSGWIWLVMALAVLGGLKAYSASAVKSSDPLSVHSARPDGALALYLWLQDLGYQVRAGGPSNLDLGGRPVGTLLVLDPTSDLWNRPGSTLRWVSQGGRLVLATGSYSTPELVRVFGGHLVPTPLAPVRVSQPLLLAPPVRNIAGRAGVVLANSPGATVMSTQYGPVLLRRRYGIGEIWFLTAPALLDNAEIAHADNRRLALNLAGAVGSPVGFYEWQGSAGGSTGSQTDWLQGTVWGVFVLFLTAVLILYRWLAGWRIGPPVVPLSDRHRPAVEYVISMAGLLRRARKRDEVLLLYQRRLRRTVLERFGSEQIEDEQLRRLLQPGSHIGEAQLIEEAGEIVQCVERVRSTRV